MTSSPRKIRSFVRRAGRVSPRQRRGLEVLWPQYGLDFSQQLIELPADKPVIMEIGFGMGDALITLAQQHPENFYIGIDVHPPGVGSLIANLEELGITNVRVFNHDAVEVLQHCFSDHSLTGVHLFFPDPWHKKRHQKRRIVQPEFVKLIQQKLKAGGYFHCATDWENYAEQMMTVISADTGFENQAGEFQFSPRPESRPLTKFEQRGLRLGHGVWDLLFTAKKI